jgi:hypothetical protein
MLLSALLAPSPRPSGYDAFAAEVRLLITSASGGGQADRFWSADLYWTLGQLISRHQSERGWKGGVLQLLAEDLRGWFPCLKGLSCRNLQYMRAFAAAWPDGPHTRTRISALPWGHITVLLDKVPDAARRNDMAAEAVRNGWSRVQLQKYALLENRTASGAEAGVHAGNGKDLVH